MDGARGPLERLEARLERLTARVDELSRIVALANESRTTTADPARPGEHEPTRPKHRRRVVHASRI